VVAVRQVLPPCLSLENPQGAYEPQAIITAHLPPEPTESYLPVVQDGADLRECRNSRGSLRGFPVLASCVHAACDSAAAMARVLLCKDHAAVANRPPWSDAIE
jgi:hypothetical protein